MKKLRFTVINSLLAVIVCTLYVSCGEESENISFFPIAKVSKFERDSYSTVLRYGNLGLAEYTVYINNEFAYSGDILYKPSSIVCTMNGVRYDFQLANTKGASRIESLTASEGSAKKYHIQYWFEDPEGRVTQARVDGLWTQPVYISYKYEGNKILINESGFDFTLELSDTDNLGYVCNVMGFSGAELTSKYVFNPDFYFLNIYGTPIKKLPQGQEFEISEDNQHLLRVGNYSYEY